MSQNPGPAAVPAVPRRLRWLVYLAVLSPLAVEIGWLWWVGPILPQEQIVPLKERATVTFSAVPATIPPALPTLPAGAAEVSPKPSTPAGPMSAGEVERLKNMLAAASPGGEVKQRKPLAASKPQKAVAAMGSLASFRDCDRCPEMVVMPTSRFNMGSSSGNSWEQPRHPVNIQRRYAIGRYEITERQWQACVEDDYCEGDRGNSKSLPVVKVDWKDTQDFVQWLSTRTGRHYRLPTEAEWALAVRGGTTTARYWGADRSNQCLYANGADLSLKKKGKVKTEFADCNDRNAGRATVGSYKANAYGLRDMAGNVWEWVEDCWADSYEGAPADGSARKMARCKEFVIRGGSWRMHPEALRSAERGHALANQRSDDLGFRVAAD